MRTKHLAKQPYTTKLPRNPAANAPMFYRRLLTIWFLLFTLNSSVAWAFSDHATGEHNVSQATDSSDGNQSPLWGADTCDDHCGHFSAHVVALIPNAAELSLATSSAAVYVSQQIPDSREPVPPFQPPIT